MQIPDPDSKKCTEAHLEAIFKEVLPQPVVQESFLEENAKEGAVEGGATGSNLPRKNK